MWGCIKNAIVAGFKFRYRNGTMMLYIDYVAQQHEEGSVIREWLVVTTTSVYEKNTNHLRLGGICRGQPRFSRG
jgi:6-phosphogluconate dehydrogenase (decarboxylating)